MQRLFFHNCYSKESQEQLASLLPDVQVIDVFNKGEIPPNYYISRLPYLVDKELTLDTKPPYIAGTFTLEFSCLDYEGSLVVGDTVFNIILNGDHYSAKADNGKINLEIDCGVPQVLELKIEGDGYVPFSAEIEVVASGA